ncbi:hypothetical protein OVY01_11545 [Robbsia sp. Bb-Pol-6]|uniref:Type 4b pilus protein PilO2 n=1 Tax=Robbsia betulipollinis TaxID=2981849 RepID=A0ABT3ZNG8_9BURK|nr:hypothetical protein [Robbsia betulipollinis]MCY0387857.1 hypothetical protein [Robbsia betulipollinis]
MARYVSDIGDIGGIGGDLMVELTWENLLGVDKEAREIGDLCARRDADRVVVITDDLGLRTAGLVGREDARADPETSAIYALAGILAGRSAGRPLVFLHALDARENDTLLIAVKAGRPEIDRVLPLPGALREAERFIETLDDDCRLCGTHSVPGTVAEPMPLPSGATLSDTERNRYRIVRQHTRFARRTVTLRARRTQVLAAGGGVLALALVGVSAGIATRLWRRPPSPAAPRAALPTDAVALHRQRVAHAMAQARKAPGRAHAARMVALLRDLPIDAARWRLAEMRCVDDTCSILWRRHPGGTLEDLLDVRPAAQPCEDDFDRAAEHIAWHDDTSAAAPASLALQKREDFYRIANSRAQRLRDAGLAMELGPTSPIVAMPSDVALPASVPVPAKGEWAVSGHLAFIDSVPGLLGRTGNMSVREMTIETDPTPPRFRAAGDFYVE